MVRRDERSDQYEQERISLSVALLAGAALFAFSRPLSPLIGRGARAAPIWRHIHHRSGGDPVTLNLATDFSTIDTLAASSIYNMLVKSDADLNPQPDLAESWKVSDDGLTYTFHLVKNATGTTGSPLPPPMSSSRSRRCSRNTIREVPWS